MNHNNTLLVELLKLDCFSSAADEPNNKFSLPPLGALFWNSPRNNDPADQNKCLEMLLNAGADPNALFSVRQLDFIRRGYQLKTVGVKDFESVKDDEDCPTVTALMVAVVHLNYDAIKMLLSNEDEKPKRKLADINLHDRQRGLTAMMYAVKTNDAEVVAQLLAKDGQKPEMKEDYHKKTSDVDLAAKDLDGYGVLHHCIEASRSPACTYDNADLVNLLCKAGCNPHDGIISPVGKRTSTAELAIHLGAVEVAKALKSKLSVAMPTLLGAPKKRLEIPEVDDCVEDWGWEMYDVCDDAQKMLKILEDKAEEEEKTEVKLTKTRSISAVAMEVDSDEEKDSDEEMDSDEEEDDDDDDGDNGVRIKKYGVVKNELTDKPSGCTATKDAEILKEYTVLMQKIDVKYGAWGMYNFYRMQIWKEKHKNLWILFTNWGRIGHYSEGQYQNTPFGSKEQAVEEFEKIFKAKAGNEWSTDGDIYEKFVNKPGKYRPIQAEHLRRIHKKELRFDLDSKIPSKLPEEIQRMIGDVTNVSMYVKAYSNQGYDVNSMPFGRIKREVVEEAKGILDQLDKLVKKKESMDRSIMKLRNKARRDNARDEAAVKAEEAKQQEVVEKIYDLSSEYHYKLPKGNMEYVKLFVVDDQDRVDQEKGRVDFVLYLETAERLLLGAQYRKDEVNPLDYIYRALGCKMRPLSPADQRAGMILRYMYNGDQAQDKVVDAIYQVSRPSEEKNFASDLGPNAAKNRKLLWHGTKASNLLSILSTGLKNAPMNAPITGKAFGNGIYTADAFDKSWSYTYNWHDDSNRETAKYVYVMFIYYLIL